MMNFLILTANAKPSTTVGNMIVVSGAFLLLVLLLKHFAWGNITEMLKKRSDKIAMDLDTAEQSRVQAAKYEQERQQNLNQSRKEAAEIVKKAKATGENTRQIMLDETRKDVVSMKEKAQIELAVEHDNALRNVKDEIAQISLEIATKILNQELSEQAHEDIINQYIESLGADHGTR